MVGELVSDSESTFMDLRKLHPHGGDVAPRGVDREIGSRSRKQPPLADDNDALALRRLTVRVKHQPTL